MLIIFCYFDKTPQVKATYGRKSLLWLTVPGESVVAWGTWKQVTELGPQAQSRESQFPHQGFTYSSQGAYLPKKYHQLGPQCPNTLAYGEYFSLKLPQLFYCFFFYYDIIFPV